MFNPLECKGNYSATSNNMKLVHWPLMGGLLHLVQRVLYGTGKGRNISEAIQQTSGSESGLTQKSDSNSGLLLVEVW